MANSRAGGMGAAGMPDLSKLGDLKARLWFLIGALIVYRLGSFIPVPGVDPQALAQMFAAQKGTILDMFNMFSGGALKRLSLFALGVMPYISASIIIQLLTATVPQLKEIQKEGESGKKRITKWTRYSTLGLATFQSIGAAVALQNQGVAIDPGPGFVFTAAVSLITGAMFLMWLGEQMTERGIGNGISILIFASIVSGLPTAVASTLELVRTGEMGPLTVIALFTVAIGVVYAVVFVERAQRRIPIHHARRQSGRGAYAMQTQHLPLKLNMSGVIPPIFASSIILFPATVVRFLGDGPVASWVANALSPGQPLYVLLYATMIIFFCFFYTALVFDSRDTADNLKRSGAFIPGVRPGQQTAHYIDQVLTRLTVAGAAYITLVCLLPEILIVYWNVPFYFGGTSLLIVVIVVMDFIAQLQALLMSQQYDGLLKKAHLKSPGRAGTVR